jgi:hypothetical protein
MIVQQFQSVLVGFLQKDPANFNQPERAERCCELSTLSHTFSLNPLPLSTARENFPPSTAKTLQVHATVLIVNNSFTDKKKLTVEAANMKTPFSVF